MQTIDQALATYRAQLTRRCGCSGGQASPLPGVEGHGGDPFWWVRPLSLVGLGIAAGLGILAVLWSIWQVAVLVFPGLVNW